LSRAESGYHDVRRRPDLDERAAVTEKVANVVAVVVAAAMTVLVHKLDDAGQRSDSVYSQTHAIEKQPRCRHVLLRQAYGTARLGNRVHATRD